MFPPASTAHTGPVAADTAREQGGHRGRAGALDDELRALEQQHDRLRDLLVVDDDDVVEQIGEDRRGSARAGMLDRDPVRDRRARRAPCPANGAHAADLDADERSSGRSASSAIAIPDARPPPPTGITTVARPDGSCSASSSPSVPWPAIDAGVVERVDEGRARLRRRAPGGGDRSSNPSPAELDRRAVSARRLDLRHRRRLGHDDRRGDAGLRAPPRRPPARGCRRSP